MNKPNPKLSGPADPAAIMEAAIQVILSVPVMVNELIEALDAITANLEILSLYVEKKGRKEGLLTDEDFKKEPEHGSDPA